MAWRGHGRGVLRGGRVGRRRKGTRYPAGARRAVAARASSTSRSAFLRGCGGASMARKKGKSRMGLLVRKTSDKNIFLKKIPEVTPELPNVVGT